MTDTPIIVKASTCADLLAMLPLLAGGPIPPGIAIAPFAGKRTPAVLRHPLPRTTNASELKAIAGTLLGMISKLGGCDAVAIAIYADDDFEVALDKYSELEHVLLKRFLTAGFNVKDTFCVASDGWSCFDEGDRRELTELTDSPVAQGWLNDADTRRVLDGTLPRTDPVVAANVHLSLNESVLGIRVDAFGIAREYDAPDPIDLLERALADGADSLGPERLAALVLACQREGDFDRVVTQVCLGPERAAEVWAETLARRDEAVRRGVRPTDLMRREPRSQQNSEIGELLVGLDGPRPDMARIEVAIDVLARAASHAPVDFRPTLLCMLAWLHWSLGLGTCAGRLLEAASGIDPRHELPAIVNAITLAVMLPHWTLDRDLRDAVGDDGTSRLPPNRADRRMRRQAR